ncbi:MAG TPA: 2-phosphosulfolactate phosphatase [Solirubrobacteraceae bacterium]|jgi:2-phosphosulfolactate phosphatase|nr:2-phosphosulfolactate phosphatase [Solirubrobacteraceae bacterium]
MPSVAIDCFHEHLAPLGGDEVIVAVDVIRATTTAVTAAAIGRKVYPAGSIEAAVRLAADLDRPILAGELGGVQPYGFDLQNSPTQMEALEQSERPIILLSTSGTRLMAEAMRRARTYPGCLRNVTALAGHLVEQGRDVRVLGADSRGEFREEDQLCAARIGRALAQAGYALADWLTEEVIERWGNVDADAILDGPSAKYLRDTDQHEDLSFVLERIDDLDTVFAIEQDEIRAIAHA